MASNSNTQWVVQRTKPAQGRSYYSIVFVDSTASCDNGATTVTALSAIVPDTGMTAPVGLILTEGRSQVMYEAGLKALEKALDQLPVKWGGAKGPRSVPPLNTLYCIVYCSRFARPAVGHSRSANSAHN